MEILQVAGIAITGVLLISVIRSIKPEFTVYIVMATVLIILILSFEQLIYVFNYLKMIYDRMNYGKEYFPILIKVLVVAYIADFTSQLCSDAGENAIGSKVELAGKIIIFYLSLPVLFSIIELINTVL